MCAMKKWLGLKSFFKNVRSKAKINPESSSTNEWKLSCLPFWFAYPVEKSLKTIQSRYLFRACHLSDRRSYFDLATIQHAIIYCKYFFYLVVTLQNMVYFTVAPKSSKQQPHLESFWLPLNKRLACSSAYESIFKRATFSSKKNLFRYLKRFLAQILLF